MNASASPALPIPIVRSGVSECLILLQERHERFATGAAQHVGGIVMNDLVAWAVGRYSYDGCFYVMAFMHPLAALLFILPIRCSRAKLIPRGSG